MIARISCWLVIVLGLLRFLFLGLVELVSELVSEMISEEKASLLRG